MPDEKVVELLEQISEKLTDIYNVMPGGAPSFVPEMDRIEHLLTNIREMFEAHERRLEEHADLLREIRDALPG